MSSLKSLDTYHTAHPRKVVPFLFSVPFSEKIIKAIIYSPIVQLDFMEFLDSQGPVVSDHGITEWMEMV